MLCHKCMDNFPGLSNLYNEQQYQTKETDSKKNRFKNPPSFNGFEDDYFIVVWDFFWCVQFLYRFVSLVIYCWWSLIAEIKIIICLWACGGVWWPDCFISKSLKFKLCQLFSKAITPHLFPPGTPVVPTHGNVLYLLEYWICMQNGNVKKKKTIFQFK